LRWEPEHDLERVFGAIGATRIADGARRVVADGQVAARRLAENLAEFLAEEQPVLIRPPALAALGADVVRLRDDVERTTKRIARLEQLLTQQAPPRLAPIPTTRPSGEPTLDS
jgi:ubiquinone biosynthesis protein UbiJ